ITGGPELLALMAGRAPRDFVFKPAAGVHGRGVLLLRFEGTAFSTPDGSLYDADALLAHAGRSVYRDWLFQERLSPHRDLVELSGTHYLQTARVVSYLDPTGRVHIPFAWLRIIAGNTAFDNFNFGASGNLVGTIDIATGQLKHVLGAAADGLGLVELDSHPRTGKLFTGFRVPHMPEIRDLVARAARAFAPLRTVGWDVGITDAGPSLVEGNVTWDPLPTRDNLLGAVNSLK
ncbi:MAG: sugar-transfer associated ATP-grasp domain-containing protein, partial [Tepidiformaceae bacterium]